MFDFDYTYILIRTLQKLILIYNFFKKLLYKKRNIKLQWNEKILLIKLDRIWDAVWGVELTKLIKKKFPKIKIDVVCNKYNKFVFLENKNLFNKIIITDCEPPIYTLKNILKFFKLIKDLFECKKYTKYLKNYDLVIDTTSKKLLLFRKNLWNEIITPIGHKEIGNFNYLQWIPNLINLKPIHIYTNLRPSKNKIWILFIWWKHPNRLNNNLYQKIIYYFQHFWVKIITLSDRFINWDIKPDYFLTLKDTFYVNNTPLKKFVKNYDFFFSWDWWVFHYASQYTIWIWFYTTTNLLAIDKVKIIQQIWDLKLLKSQLKNNLYISKLLPCSWCFQIWCKKKYCSIILDNQLKIIIKKIIQILYN